MKRIHTGHFVPKYRNGVWKWNEEQERLEFESRSDARLVKEEFKRTGGFKFSTKVNQIEEAIFRQEFQRSEISHDADVILMHDIKNVVLFLAPSEIITNNFVHFVHTLTVDLFLHSLVIYFEHYLKMVEYVLIRRDEIAGEKAQVQSIESVEIKRIFSSQLSQYRLLLARNYSPIIMGTGEMKPYYHIAPVVKISKSIKDKRFHEAFLAFATQVVWIAMHRRAYDAIDGEMNRLFRSEHFRLPRGDRLQFSKQEASMLYGKNYRRVNYRAQSSPLIQELTNVSAEDVPILWIGERKYRGNDYRILELELEYMVPGSQLSLIDVTHGILGHPKLMYDTLLHLDWEAVRFQHYSEEFDPYRIWRQPGVKIPKPDSEKIRRFAQQYEEYYDIKYLYEKPTYEQLRKWCQRDKIVNYFKTEGMITRIWTKCEKEVQDRSYGKTVQQITEWYMAAKRKLKKHRMEKS